MNSLQIWILSLRKAVNRLNQVVTGIQKLKFYRIEFRKILNTVLTDVNLGQPVKLNSLKEVNRLYIILPDKQMHKRILHRI